MDITISIIYMYTTRLPSLVYVFFFRVHLMRVSFFFFFTKQLAQGGVSMRTFKGFRMGSFLGACTCNLHNNKTVASYSSGWLRLLWTWFRVKVERPPAPPPPKSMDFKILHWRVQLSGICSQSSILTNKIVLYITTPQRILQNLTQWGNKKENAFKLNLT